MYRTIDDIRRSNLQILERESGSVRELAERIEKAPSQVSQWLNASADSKNGRKRSISTDIARHIESKTNKEHGWMDADHENLMIIQDPKERELLLQYRNSNPQDRSVMERMMRAAISLSSDE